MTGFFIDILNWIFGWVNNYGWSVIIFTVVIKLILLPLDVKSRKSMRAMSLLNPQLEVLKTRYANDREKLNRKTQELYRKNHVSPMSGCLPILIQMPILFIMFAAMRRVAAQQQAKMVYSWLQNAELVSGSTGQFTFDWAKLQTLTNDIRSSQADFGNTQSWLWIKSVFQADNMNRFVIPSVEELNTMLKQYGEYLTGDELSQAKAAIEAYVGSSSLDADSRLKLIQAVCDLSADETLLTDIEAFLTHSGENYTQLSILSDVSDYIRTDVQAYKELCERIEAIIEPNAENTTKLAFVEYVLHPYLFDANDLGAVKNFVSGFTVENTPDGCASAIQQVRYMLDDNAYSVVFGTKVDSTLLDITPHFKTSVLLFTIEFPTKFNRYINGYFILPVLACATQVLASKLQPASPTPEPPKPASKDPNAKPQPGTGKIMKWLFPIMSIWICWSSSAAFAIYWVFVNVWSIISSYAVNYYLKLTEGQGGDKPEQQDSGNSKFKKEALKP